MFKINFPFEEETFTSSVYENVKMVQAYGESFKNFKELPVKVETV